MHARSPSCMQVCTHGRFLGRNSDWTGPPRAHLRTKFERWSEHLCAGIELGGGGAKAIHHSVVQVKGGFQNTFIIAERPQPPPCGEHSSKSGVSAGQEATLAAKGETAHAEFTPPRGLTRGLWGQITADEMRDGGGS